MKQRRQRSKRKADHRFFALAATGVLTFLAPLDGFPQTAGTIIPRGTVPLLRGVVSGQAVVNAPVATPTGNLLTIRQIDPRVIIDWSQFNIANGSEVQFIQPSATAAALNRIYSADPSIIQGKLTANGQIFLINQNGILFDRGAQVDVNTLVASTLNMSNSQFAQGLVAAGTAPSFEGRYDSAGNTIAGSTPGTSATIQIGANGEASAPAPTLQSGRQTDRTLPNTGGAIILIAPVINNQSGVLTSTDGQVILAAGNKAYLQFGSESNTALRGLAVEIEAASGPLDVTSMIRNLGTIQADRGNVTLAALAVNQAGRISASTAMQHNGSIYLQSRTLDGTRGTVTLAPGSVIEAPLDLTDKSTLAENQSYDPYRAQVNIQASTIIDQGVIRAPAGVVTFDAADLVNPSAARVYLDSNSVIDVSGVTANVAYASNFLTFKVTSNELNNSPDQKNGILRGATVTVDLRKGSSLLNLAAYQATRARSLAEKATSAGTVSMNSTGDVIQRKGARINANGGSIVYEGGTSKTTELVGADGKFYNITTAPEQLVYTSVADNFTVGHGRWGLADVYSSLFSGLFVSEAGYVEGAAGGALSFTGPGGLVLDGRLTAGTTVGANQMANAPRGGSLTIGSYDGGRLIQNFGVSNIAFRADSADSLGASFDAGTALSAAQKDTLVLAADNFSASGPDGSGNFVQRGFDAVTLGANGRITVPTGVELSGGLAGKMTFRAQQIDVSGKITLSAGAIVLESDKTVGVTTPGVTGNGIRLEGELNTAGLWINNSVNATAPNPTLYPTAVSALTGSTAVSTLNGGSVSLVAPADVVTSIELKTGSTIDVSGGGSDSASGKITGGTGGSILVSAPATAALGSAPLELNGALRGYSLTNGGSFKLETASISIAPTALAAGDITPAFFTMGGFSSYALTGTDGLTVTAGTQLHPQQDNFVVDSILASTLASGRSLASIAQVLHLPDYQRKPTSLALTATQGTLRVGAGALIATDPLGSISLKAANGDLDLLGSLSAHGGKITASASSVAQSTSSLHLGAGAVLDASGTFVAAKPNAQGLRQGTVISGGSVTLNASNAQLLADAGSAIRVDGAAQVLDQPGASVAVPYVPTLTTSDAGLVSIQANDRVALDATLNGHAQGHSAGGAFAFTYANRNDFAGTFNLAHRIVVTEASAAGTPAAGNFSDARVAMTPLKQGGFDKLRLSAEDALVFQGASAGLDFKRGVTLDSQQISVADGGKVSVSGAAVQLSNSYGQRVAGATSTALDNRYPNLPVATVAGTGELDVHGNTVDLTGKVTINGVAKTVLTSDHDLRLSGRLTNDVVNGNLDATHANLKGSLTSVGDIEIQATQVYPTTRSDFTIAVADGLTGAPVVGGTIRISGNNAAAGDVFSAGGHLSLAADKIVQGGIVKAPLGSLTMNAVTSLDLLAGSTTSVSGDGLLIPYGGTVAGVSWLYSATGADPAINALTTAPEKQLVLSGKSINLDSGSKVNIAGGGNILGIEFVPGSGGSTDALIQNNTYALIPASKLASMPVDLDIALKQDLGFGKVGSIYNSVHIATDGIVPAGDYVLLPAYYALLPGAYIAQVQSGASYGALQPGQVTSLANGLNVLPAWRTVAGTDIRAQETIGLLVRPGSDAKKLSDYNLFSADFFTTQAQRSGLAAPRTPDDAGRLSIAALQALKLDGSLITAPSGTAARSAEIDITGDKIAVVDHTGRIDIAANYLQIDAGNLSRINGSVLVGGTRVETSTGITVTPTASDIIVANDASTSLQAPELMLASTDGITLRSGSSIAASGTASSTAKPQDILIDPSAGGAGAFLRASNAGPINLSRTAPVNAGAGSLLIEAGATVAASGSLLLDATRDTISAGKLNVAAGGALALSSSVVSLGDTPANLSGLVLNQAQLSDLNQLGALTLKSYGTIDVFGAGVALGSANLKQLQLDGQAIVAHAGLAGSAASLSATGQTVTLSNSTGGRYAGSTSATGGGMSVTGNTVVIGAGDKAIAGFTGLSINTPGEVVEQGVGSLRVGGTLDVTAGRIAGGSGANQTWSAAELGSALGQAPARYYDVKLAAAAQPASPATAAGVGAQLIIEGANVDDGVAITAKSGNVTLAARGATAGTTPGAGVHLGSGAAVDVSGYSKDFHGTTALVNAGSVTLTADHDGVALDAGSQVNVAGAAAGGDAGTLVISGATVALNGSLSGAAKAGQKQGQFSLDIGRLDNFSALNATLNQNGFTERRDLRVRDGAVTIAQGDVVTAHHVRISADNGTIAVLGGGLIDASSGSGGSTVELNAQSGLSLASGSVINASATATASDATAPYVNGGTVALSTQSGTLDFASGSTIDVRAGAKGNAGKVSFTAARTTTNDNLDASLQGTVLSQRHAGDAAARIDVEASRAYQLPGAQTTLGAADIATLGADNVAFMQGVDVVAIASGIKGDGGTAQGNVHVRPAVEVRSTGPLQLVDNWDLTDAGAWVLANNASSAEAGTLTIRSASDLTLANVALGLPDNTLHASSWNLNLVGGADLAAANRMQTLSAGQLNGHGDVLLDGANARVTSGTGSINIAAGHDFRINNNNGVVYTSGAPVSIPANIYSSGATARGNDALGRWAQGGGNISIAAQHDAIGTSSEWINDWYRRTMSGVVNDKSAWWTLRDNFHQNIGALGGGDVSIAAGHDINNLSAMTPTSGRVYSTNPITVRVGRVVRAGAGPFFLDVQGGGNLSLVSGNDVIGGDYLVSRGTGSIKAAGSVGGVQATQLFLMGESNDIATRTASIKVEAGGNIAIQSINDPTTLRQPQSVGSGDPSVTFGRADVPFNSYSPDSAVSLLAKGGDIGVLGQLVAKVPLNVQDGTSFTDANNEVALPASLAMIALNGSVKGNLGKQFYTYPSATGGIQILAGKDVTSFNLTQSDLGPASLGASGVNDWTNKAGQLSLNSLGFSGRLVNFSAPGRYVDEVVALGGSVMHDNFTFPGVARVWADQNIGDVQLTLQNTKATDVSEIVANQGFFHPGTLLQTTIAGPGQLLVQTGSDIDLGNNASPVGGLVATGNSGNSSLASSASARLTLVAGVTGDVALDQLDSAYADWITAGKNKDVALAAKARDKVFGHAKIATGNIYSYLTSIQTLQGSDIDLLAPGGNITVGLTTPAGGKTIGVLTNTGGAIRSYLSGDFDINQGKILTAQGGDIMIYTTDGSIDAGRGAKTSITTPPPQRIPVYDASNPPVLLGYRYVISAAAGGSGIQTVTSDPDGPGGEPAPKAGSIYLFAPSGTIDAGEAGIASGGNIFIAAQTVRNASNISASGASVGVPTVESGSLASSMATSGTNTSSATTSADEAAKSASEAARKAGSEAFKASILTVEVLGFGENNCKEGQKDCFTK
jgi:filamentous hemagglutinin family protein